MSERLKQKVEEYYLNPKTCDCCDKIIFLKRSDNYPINFKRARQQKFCSTQCSARSKEKNEDLKQKNFCKNCKISKRKSRSQFCEECFLICDSRRNGFHSSNPTKKDYITEYGERFGQRIRDNSKSVIKIAGIPRKCVFCSYEVQVDVHHIKAIKDFSDNDTIEEINSLENLVCLCPNHHVEVERGWADLKYAQHLTHKINI